MSVCVDVIKDSGFIMTVYSAVRVSIFIINQESLILCRRLHSKLIIYSGTVCTKTKGVL